MFGREWSFIAGRFAHRGQGIARDGDAADRAPVIASGACDR